MVLYKCPGLFRNICSMQIHKRSTRDIAIDIVIEITIAPRFGDIDIPMNLDLRIYYIGIAVEIKVPERISDFKSYTP